MYRRRQKVVFEDYMKMAMVAKKSKKTQYIIGSVVAVLILFMWISLPLMNKTGSSSASYAGGFSKKSADLSMLSDGAGADAPGAPLSGELVDNPATALDMAASALFSSPDSDSSSIDTEQQVGSASTADGAVPVPSDSGSNYGSVPKGKLSVLPSLTAGNANSNTVGGTHNKFFGQETAKADFKPSDLGDIKVKTEKGQAIMAVLKKAQDQSIQAAKSNNLNDARGSAASAFGSAPAKASNSDLETEVEQKSAESGIQLGKVDQSLKKNDPSLNKKDIKLPEPKEAQVDNSDEEMKKMILQMIIQATVGAVFGGIGSAISAGITGSISGKK